MIAPGARNSIADVEGVTVGHATDDHVGTGVTTILCDGPWIASLDIRGGGRGVREIETLAPENPVPGVHAIVLSGGSVFGLAAAEGVVAGLSARGVGYRQRPDVPAMPIVPAAVLHDLTSAGDKAWGRAPPYRALGLASLDAVSRDVAIGSVGAGRGARAGWRKGGIGTASIVLDDLIVGVLVAVNAVGSTFMPDGVTPWAWPFELAGEFGGRRPDVAAALDLRDPAPDESRLGTLGRLAPGLNTTLAVVATNADLTKGEAKRVAMMAHDGMARAIRPAHTPFDGDTVFTMASGAIRIGEAAARQAAVARLGSAAADCLARAIARGVHHA